MVFFQFSYVIILIVKISSQLRLSSDKWLSIFPKLPCFHKLTVVPLLHLYLWELGKPSSQWSFKLTAFLTNLGKWELDFLISNTAWFFVWGEFPSS